MPDQRRYLFSRDSFHILSQQVRHCLSAALDHLDHGDSDEMIAVEIITQLDSCLAVVLPVAWI
jgi:hypothetical protein